MIIRVTTDNRTTIHPYPTGAFREKHDVLTGLIGNGCDLVEHVRPRRLYTFWKVSTDIESGKMACILVDESGALKENQVNELASYLYGYTIYGNVLFVGEGYVDGEPDFKGLPEDVAMNLMLRIEDFLNKKKAATKDDQFQNNTFTE